MSTLKSSLIEQRAVIRFFLWAKGLDANEIHSEMVNTIMFYETSNTRLVYEVCLR